MRTRELIRREYRRALQDGVRFACKHYHEDTCPRHEDVCDCDRRDGFPKGSPGKDDDCPHFTHVTLRRYQEVLCWEREDFDDA